MSITYIATPDGKVKEIQTLEVIHDKVSILASLTKRLAFLQAEVLKVQTTITDLSR